MFVNDEGGHHPGQFDFLGPMTLVTSLHPTGDKTTLVEWYRSTLAGDIGFFGFETFSSSTKVTQCGYALEDNSTILLVVGGYARVMDGKSCIPLGRGGRSCCQRGG